MRIATEIGIVLSGGLVGALTIQAASQTSHVVTVIADREQCALSSSVQVWRLSYGLDPGVAGPSEAIVIAEPLARGGPLVRAFVTFVDGQQMTDSCRWTFSPLSAGEYVALLVRPDGSGGSVRFALPNDQTTVTVPAPQVVVSGVVTRSGIAAAQVMFRISPVQFSRPAIIVVTDEQGRFTRSLDRAGVYEASSANNRAQTPWVRQFTVLAGNNKVVLEMPAD